MVETPHFQIGHMCAGCEISNCLHTGCVINGGVRIIKNNQYVDKEKNSLVKQLPEIVKK